MVSILLEWNCLKLILRTYGYNQRWMIFFQHSSEKFVFAVNNIWHGDITLTNIQSIRDCRTPRLRRIYL